MGAISADLCVFGDIRDLGIQGWKYLTGGQDFDGFVTILSAAGIGLSTAPFLDGTNALAKNILKYLKKVPASINKGLLKEFLSGKISPKDCKKIWTLLKKPMEYSSYNILPIQDQQYQTSWCRHKSYIQLQKNRQRIHQPNRQHGTVDLFIHT